MPTPVTVLLLRGAEVGRGESAVPESGKQQQSASEGVFPCGKISFLLGFSQSLVCMTHEIRAGPGENQSGDSV